MSNRRASRVDVDFKRDVDSAALAQHINKLRGDHHSVDIVEIRAGGKTYEGAWVKSVRPGRLDVVMGGMISQWEGRDPEDAAERWAEEYRNTIESSRCASCGRSIQAMDPKVQERAGLERRNKNPGIQASRTAGTNPSNAPRPVQKVYEEAKQSARDAYEAEKEYYEEHPDEVGADWYLEDDMGPRGVTIRHDDDRAGKEAWLVSDKLGKAASLIYYPDEAEWYYMPPYGRENLIKGGTSEALANAELMFHG